MVTPVKRIDLTPTPRGYATSLAAIIRGGTYQDKQWVLREMIKACKAVLPEPKPVSGPGYVTVAPTPEGYARIFYRLIEQGDAKGRAYAISEMTRIFEAAFKKKNPRERTVYGMKNPSALPKISSFYQLDTFLSGKGQGMLIRDVLEEEAKYWRQRWSPVAARRKAEENILSWWNDHPVPKVVPSLTKYRYPYVAVMDIKKQLLRRK